MTNFTPIGSAVLFASVEGERSRDTAVSQLVSKIEQQAKDTAASARQAVSQTPNLTVIPFFTGVSHSVEQNAEGTYDGTITATVTTKEY
ncbi:TPA: hypothetical protein VMH12_001671 [Streptococcus pyogenes]|nr:hypothetical protein [Streptococcus pyogenes]